MPVPSPPKLPYPSYILCPSCCSALSALLSAMRNTCDAHNKDSYRRHMMSLFPQQLHTPRRRFYTPYEVALHSSPDDCWVSFLGGVYNLTALLKVRTSTGVMAFNSSGTQSQPPPDLRPPRPYS